MNLLHLYKAPMTEAEFAAFLMRRFTILDALITDPILRKVADVDHYLEHRICSRYIRNLTQQPINEILTPLNISQC